MATPGTPRRRVGIVYPFFPHYRQAVIRALLQSTEHEYILVGDRASAAVDATIKVWEIPASVPFVDAPCRRVGRLVFQRGLIRFALRRDVDAIIYHAGMYWPSLWISAAVARLTGKRVYNWTQGWTRRETGVRRWLRRTLYRLFDGLLLYGHIAKMLGLAEGFAPERLHVIYNSMDYEAQKRARAGVTPERIADVRRRLFAAPRRPLVICTTRLTPVRRLDQLLEALALLKARGRELNLLLVGDGPERQTLEDLARKLDLPVHFYGACYDEAVLAELVMSANVAVSPGKIGLTAMHSLAFGTPVISHDDALDQAPEWEAIIPGKTGGVFRRDDVADLARAIEEWTRTELPEEQARDACYAIIERFYNPAFQRIAIDRAIRGEPADDLFWMKAQARQPQLNGEPAPI
jgi:glycosyltransferase involved in cell wall biosynthesis